MQVAAWDMQMHVLNKARLSAFQFLRDGPWCGEDCSGSSVWITAGMQITTNTQNEM